AGEARARSPSPILLTATDISPRADLVSLLRRERTRRGPAGGQRQGCGGQDREQRRKHDDRVRVVIRREGGGHKGSETAEDPTADAEGQAQPEGAVLRGEGLGQVCGEDERRQRDAQGETGDR